MALIIPQAAYTLVLSNFLRGGSFGAEKLSTVGGYQQTAEICPKSQDLRHKNPGNDKRFQIY